MLKKIVTTVGLVSVFGASTAMATDLTISAATLTPYKVSNETIGAARTGGKTSGVLANKGTTFLNVDHNNGASLLDLDMVIATGFASGATGSSDYFVKIDLGTAAFSTVASATQTLIPANNGSSTLFSGGVVGTSSAIYQFDITGTITATATLSTAFADLATNGDPTVTFSIFETLTEANKAAGTPVATYSKQIINFSPGLKRTATAKSPTAEVSGSFKKYLNTAGTAQVLVGQLGSVSHTVNTSHLAATGAATILANLYAPATTAVTVTGDLSNGTWWFAASGCAGSAAPPAGDQLTLNAAKTSGTTTGSILDAKNALCNVTDGVVEIPKSAYLMGLVYAKGITGSNGAAAGVGVALGSVKRNGTSNRINYLTTFSGYNQRVYINNRGTADATYTFTFQTEAGTTAVAGTAATGTSKAGELLVLKAADIVTLTGKTRAAASLAIVGTPANFSIATQQVNISSGGTDTTIIRE